MALSFSEEKANCNRVERHPSCLFVLQILARYCQNFTKWDTDQEGSTATAVKRPV